MKTKLALVPLAVAAIALTLSPAMAKSKQHRMHHHYSQSYHDGWNGGRQGGGWNSRNVSDPSYVSPGYRRNQALGRCVEDLGYGRYEYCGW